MKSLLITFDFPPIVSGISTAFYNIWKYLPKEECVILAPWAKGSRKLDMHIDKKVCRLYMPLGNNIFKKIIRALLVFCYCLVVVRKEKIELLVCGQPIIIGAVGLFFKKIYHMPYQVWVYGGEVVKFKKSRGILWFLRRVLEEADKLVVNSEFTRQVYRNFGIAENKIIKIIPAVDGERFKPDISVSNLVSKYSLEDKKIILTVARLSERKGHDVVIKALDKVKKTFPNIIYLIVGMGPDEKRLKKMVADYHLEDKVIFIGFVDEEDLPRYYNICDIYVMPTREVKGIDTLEGFGISFIEASACEKPVIGGRSGGSNEAVLDDETGYLVDPFDIDDLAKKITELLLKKDVVQEMGRRGRQRVIEDFQWKHRATILKDYL